MLHVMTSNIKIQVTSVELILCLNYPIIVACVVAIGIIRKSGG